MAGNGAVHHAGIEFLQVQTMTDSRAEAMELARAAVEARLAAGTQVAGPMASTFWWNEEIERAARVTVRAQDRDGRTFELEAEGLLAVAIQHEYDHLQGVLMIDHLGTLKKRLVNRKMQRRQGPNAEA